TINLTSGALAITKNLTINSPGANLLTISGNNHFPVFDINAADVTFSGLAIAGNINAYNSSNLTFINSTISGDNLKIDNPTGELRLINSTINGNNSVNISTNALTLTDGSQIRDLSNTTNAGNAGDLTISTSKLTIPSNTTNAGDLTISVGNSGQISGGRGGNITLRVDDLLLLRRVPQPSTIAGGSNSSGAGGEITVTASSISLTRVPEPSAIAGSILAGSLAWLAKRKQAAFPKAKV
ncbi:PEP-CTERM sorting domain-containing protein, partial [Nostoc sp. CHAB 5715]|uniref:PEP-CTERM sorting domain-containing protein n=1 Tax=Nostoc sp. CHAB 5715 TaxID=2780400 RepID=UPI001E3158D3